MVQSWFPKPPPHFKVFIDSTHLWIYVLHNGSLVPKWKCSGLSQICIENDEIWCPEASSHFKACTYSKYVLTSLRKSASLCHYVITSLHHYVIMLLRHYVSTSVRQYVSTSVRHYVITSLSHYVIMSLRHYIITSLRHYVITSLFKSFCIFS